MLFSSSGNLFGAFPCKYYFNQYNQEFVPQIAVVLFSQKNMTVVVITNSQMSLTPGVWFC